MWRTFQVGAAANHRYLDAMAAAPLKGKGVEALDALCRPRTKNGRTYARFSPLTKGDLTLFRAALAGEHAIGGFRNRDGSIPVHLSTPTTPTAAANGYHASSSSSAATAGCQAPSRASLPSDRLRPSCDERRPLRA